MVLNIASFSDVHVFHPNVPTEHILDRLREAFPDNKATSELDLIVIPGDFFDRINSLNSPNVKHVFIWIVSFFRLCSKHDIAIRILEGTPSHDRGQPMLFDQIASSTRLHNLDFKYVDTLAIETISKWGIDILYIPDEWRSSHEDIWIDVKELLAEHGLEKVDYTLMHGCFEYQVPANVPMPSHDSSRYQRITREFVFCGHIHQRSKKGNILVAGSFDRNCHGDEGEKGHWRVIKGEPKFIVSKKSTVYLTIDLKGCSVVKTLDTFDRRKYKDLPMGSNIRLLLNQGDYGIRCIDHLNDTYDNIKFSAKVIQVEEEFILDVVDNDVYEVSPKNLTESLFEYIDSTGEQLTGDTRSGVSDLINKVR